MCFGSCLLRRRISIPGYLIFADSLECLYTQVSANLEIDLRVQLKTALPS